MDTGFEWGNFNPDPASQPQVTDKVSRITVAVVQCGVLRRSCRSFLRSTMDVNYIHSSDDVLRQGLLARMPSAPNSEYCNVSSRRRVPYKPTRELNVGELTSRSHGLSNTI